MDAVFKHVLVATDGSPLADKAIALARRLSRDARVTALIVVHDYGLAEYMRAALRQRPDAQELREEIVAEGRRLLNDAIARAAGGDTPIERRVVLSEKAPHHEIVALAQREGCDLIVMSSHGLGGRLAGPLGSQASAVLVEATVPVLVVR
jgi:nucleotide-binding universal stress UspA family protein